MESSIVSFASSVSLEAGVAAVYQERYQDAISILEAFCHDCAANAQCRDREYLQAQMHLVKTYAQTAQTERATILCQRLAACENAQVQIWAQRTLKTLGVEKEPTNNVSPKLSAIKAIEILALLLQRRTLQKQRPSEQNTRVEYD